MTSQGQKEGNDVTGGDVTDRGVTSQGRRRKMTSQWVTSRRWRCEGNEDVPSAGNYVARNYVAGNYVAKVCGNLRPRRSEDVAAAVAAAGPCRRLWRGPPLTPDVASERGPLVPFHHRTLSSPRTYHAYFLSFMLSCYPFLEHSLISRTQRYLYIVWFITIII